MKNWNELVESLDVSGAAKKVLTTGTLMGWDTDIYIRIAVSPDESILITPVVIDKIASALEKRLLAKIHLEIEVREEKAVIVGFNINRDKGLN